jgi:hypothetical protein
MLAMEKGWPPIRLKEFFHRTVMVVWALFFGEYTENMQYIRIYMNKYAKILEILLIFHGETAIS